MKCRINEGLSNNDLHETNWQEDFVYSFKPKSLLFTASKGVVQGRFS